MDQVDIFVSYSRKDSRWVDPESPQNLIPWLADALRNMKARVWYDLKLRESAGVDYRGEIANRIEQAHIAILLLSQDFLISDFIRKYEMPLIKEKVFAGRMSIIPIQVKKISWKGERDYKWLLDRQIIPGKPTPLVDYAGDLKKWEDVKIEILDACKERIENIRKGCSLSILVEKENTADLSSQGKNKISDTPKNKHGIPGIIRKFGISSPMAAGIAICAILIALAGLRQYSFVGTKSVTETSDTNSAVLRIVEPGNGTSLPPVITVRGTASRNVNVWLVVHPTATRDYWVQPKVERYSRGEWFGEIHLGSPGSIDRGKSYEILAVAETEKYLEEGMVLNGWPNSNWHSNIVLVTRE